MTAKTANHIFAVLMSDADETSACLRAVHAEYEEAKESGDVDLMENMRKVESKLRRSLQATETALLEIEEIIDEIDDARG